MGAYWRLSEQGSEYEKRLKSMTAEELMNEVDGEVVLVNDSDKWFFIECEIQNRIGFKGEGVNNENGRI